MKKLLLITMIALMSATSFAAKDDHAGHNHTDEGIIHKLGRVSIANITYEVMLHGEITPGGAAAIQIEVEYKKAPGELRVWIGAQNGRGSVKSLLRADEHGHFHGHLEVPAKLPHGSAVWLDMVTNNGRKRGSVSIPESDHKHDEH